MTSQPLVPSLWPVGLSLPAREAQNLRHRKLDRMRTHAEQRLMWQAVVRRCRMALTAVNEAGRPPLLDMVLPLGSQNLSILHGLLAISVRASSRSPQDLEHHHMALSEMHAEIRAAQSGIHDLDQLKKMLSLSLLLCIFNLHRCDGTWIQHTRGMVALVRSTDQNALAQSPLGNFLLSSCAFNDLSALSVGSGRLSQKAWLSWMTSRTKDLPEGTLSALEITSGYPDSLLDLIARISELAEEKFYSYLQSSLHDAVNHLSPMPSNRMAITPSDDIEIALIEWRMPTLPSTMSAFQQLGLRIAWQTLNKAALVYLWRGHGFHSNLLNPLRADRSEKAKSHITEMLTDIEALIEMGRSHNLSIGNAMLWPTAIIACESTFSPQPRKKQILGILDDMQKLYYMDHPQELARALRHLWDKATLPTVSYLSLEQVCIELQLSIPLF